MEKDIISYFLQVQSQIKSFHWQTKSYARHIAYDRIHGELSALIDTFVEVYQGKYGRIKVNGEISIININEEEANGFVDQTISQISKELPISEKDTDLVNIKDEMIASLNTLKYLLTLK